MEMHTWRIFRAEDVRCSTVVRLTWPVRLDQLELFLSFFGSKLAAGRRGWNTVRSAEWSSEGEPSRTQKTFFLLGGVKAFSELHLIWAAGLQTERISWYIGQCYSDRGTLIMQFGQRYRDLLLSRGVVNLSLKSKNNKTRIIQTWVICKIGLCFLDALCPSLFLSCLISSLSHTFFFLSPSMLTLSPIPPCSIARYSTT